MVAATLYEAEREKKHALRDDAVEARTGQREEACSQRPEGTGEQTM